MTGLELKNKIKSTHYSFKDIAEGLGCTPQSLTSVFNASDVRSGTIEKIAEIMGVPMSFFYPIAPVMEQTNNNIKEVHARNLGAIGNNGTVNEGANAELINKLLEQLDAQRKQIDKLTDNNQKLMDKLLG